jgi:protein gp37
MADGTKIEWSEATWNIITGCTVLSPGCKNCYAMKLAGTRLAQIPSRAGLTVETKAGPVWNGQVRFNEQWLDQPLRWRRPRLIFVCAHGDLFHEAVPDEWIDKVFAIMALSFVTRDDDGHTFQVLTKRSARMRAYLLDPKTPIRVSLQMKALKPGLMGENTPPRWPLPNVWLGVSAEDQQRADERIPHLLATPAAVRWVSAEPLLGELDLRDIPWPSDRRRFPETDDISDARSALSLIGGTRLDWVVAGGESGPGARPMHPAWPRAIRDQCAAAGVPFFFKQWGSWAPFELRPFRGGADMPHLPSGATINLRHRKVHHFQYEHQGMVLVDKADAGRLLDGRTWDEMPKTAAGEV